jgi:DNA-binding MarR family transcriptional regulator
MQPGTSSAAQRAAPPASAAPPADSAPPIDAARLRMAIARLARMLRRHHLAGLTPTQLSALATVEKTGPVQLSVLAAAEGIAPSTLTRLVTSLEESGYVRRSAVPGDARASMLSITPDGRAVIERIREESTLMLAGLLTQLTAGQQAAIAAALPALEQLAGPDNGG